MRDIIREYGFAQVSKFAKAYKSLLVGEESTEIDLIKIANEVITNPIAHYMLLPFFRHLPKLQELAKQTVAQGPHSAFAQ